MPPKRASSSRSRAKSQSVANPSSPATPTKRSSMQDIENLTLSTVKEGSPIVEDDAGVTEGGSGAKESPTAHSTRVKSLDPRVHEYITPGHLGNLAQYEYRGSDYSVIGKHIMQPYWRWAVEFMPLNLAPNLITLLGFFASTSGTALLLGFHWGTESGEIPAFAWVYAAFSLFVYQTLDSIDGKQARRTGTSGPLGELFDHGCDAFFGPLCQMNTVMAVGQSDYKSFWLITVLCIGLVCAIWEQFATGTLDLGYINGPTEGVLITCTMYLLTAFYGTTFWTTPFGEPFVFPPRGTWIEAYLAPSWSAFQVENAGDVMFVFMNLAAIITIATNLIHVATIPSVHKNLRVVTLWSFLLPPIALMAGFHSWTQLFPRMHHEYLMIPEFAFGMTTSFCATRMTVARLCKMEYNGGNTLSLVNLAIVWGFVGAATLVKEGTITQVTSGEVEQYAGYASVAMALGGIATYMHMAVGVFRQLTNHLGVNLLTLTEKQKAAIKVRVAAEQKAAASKPRTSSETKKKQK